MYIILRLFPYLLLPASHFRLTSNKRLSLQQGWAQFLKVHVFEFSCICKQAVAFAHILPVCHVKIKRLGIFDIVYFRVVSSIMKSLNSLAEKSE